MKRKKHSELFILLLIWAAILYTNQMAAQTLTTITIKAGEDLNAVYKQMYRFPQFTSGKVYFMNKDSATGRLNYNLLMEKMQFIDKRGDTLVLSDDNPIKLVAIDTNIFYCNSEGCVELIAGLPSAELAVSNHLKLYDEQKIGAYGLPTSTQTIENKNSFKTNSDYTLLLNRDLVFTKETHYYLIDSNRHFITVNKKNLQKLLPGQKGVIENYLKENQVDFKNEFDLKNFFSYIAKSYWD
jgi:hypothetical protein